MNAQTTTRKRANCPTCGLDFRLTKSGTMFRHVGMTPAGFSTGETCPGAGKAPVVTYRIEFGLLGASRPVPPLVVTTDDINVLQRAVVAHARPHMEPVLAELGRPEYADCMFQTNPDRTKGQFLWLDVMTGEGARFLPARINTAP
ncbi:hypothetical protein [Streptomyces flavidovirens]|uniref:hypothetical protein n=1 Tax=Streptomyces flavidovirens TaxID=67298 RepID=UPI0036CA317F